MVLLGTYPVIVVSFSCFKVEGNFRIKLLAGKPKLTYSNKAVRIYDGCSGVDLNDSESQ